MSAPRDGRLVVGGGQGGVANRHLREARRVMQSDRQQPVPNAGAEPKLGSVQSCNADLPRFACEPKAARKRDRDAPHARGGLAGLERQP